MADGIKKVDALGKTFADEARELLERYLVQTRVLMGDGSYSQKLCVLCEERLVPATGAAPDCVCGQARDLLRGYRK